MATHSKISILHPSIQTILDEIKKFYKVTDQLSLPVVQEWYFHDYDKKTDTIIVSCNYSIHWVDIVFNYHDLTDPLIFDFLIYLSKNIRP